MGWYGDGVKRTLTDAQVEMFRHSEWEMMLREQRRKRNETEDEDEANEEGMTRGAKKRTLSFSSDASSLDDDLIGLSKTTQLNAPLSRSPSPAPTTQTHHVPSFDSTKSVKATMTAPSTKKPSQRKKKQRKEEIAYEDRNKRKWEEHVVTVEPVRGTWMYESKTENRVLREMDDVKAESVELDY